MSSVTREAGFQRGLVFIAGNIFVENQQVIQGCKFLHIVPQTFTAKPESTVILSGMAVTILPEGGFYWINSRYYKANPLLYFLYLSMLLLFFFVLSYATVSKAQIDVGRFSLESVRFLPAMARTKASMPYRCNTTQAAIQNSAGYKA